MLKRFKTKVTQNKCSKFQFIVHFQLLQSIYTQLCAVQIVSLHTTPERAGNPHKSPYPREIFDAKRFGAVHASRDNWVNKFNDYAK